MSSSTGFPDLDALLADLAAETQTILAANFVGAYLQGSFALGDADEHSDVDFAIVTAGAVTETELGSLQEMHARLHRRDVRWARHLEGSYFTRDLILSVDPARTPLLFLDHGARSLVPDDHCNTAVVRWVLREAGVTLAGPPAATLVAPVTAADLRREAVWMLAAYAEWARVPGGMSAWKQSYLVVSVSRILYTLEKGEVASKRRSGEWAMAALAPEWRGLVRAALDVRGDPSRLVLERATPDNIERTIAFAAHGSGRARERSDAARS